MQHFATPRPDMGQKLMTAFDTDVDPTWPGFYETELFFTRMDAQGYIVWEMDIDAMRDLANNLGGVDPMKVRAILLDLGG